jgi:hypothetical protein
MQHPPVRTHQPIDAVLHLLDRQVVDVEDRLAGKVDDLELCERPDGSVVVTALLTGAPAFLPRFSGRLGRTIVALWAQMGEVRAERTLPWRIDLDLVDRLDSAVHLCVPRHGVQVPQSASAAGERLRRLDDLIDMAVVGPDGAALGGVLDVRLESRSQGSHRRYAIVGLLVGRGRPGSMLGYDRRPDQGPWLVNRVVRRLHRHSGQLPWQALTVDWSGRRITSTRGLTPLDQDLGSG